MSDPQPFELPLDPALEARSTAAFSYGALDTSALAPPRERVREHRPGSVVFCGAELHAALATLVRDTCQREAVRLLWLADLRLPTAPAHYAYAYTDRATVLTLRLVPAGPLAAWSDVILGPRVPGLYLTRLSPKPTTRTTRLFEGGAFSASPFERPGEFLARLVPVSLRLTAIKPTV